MDDFELFLEEIGVTPEQMEEARKEAIDFIPNDQKEVEFHESPIHGVGMFSRINFEKGAYVVDGMRNRKWTEAGRFVNHSSDPNITMGARLLWGFQFIAKKAIKVGDEMTVDYRIVRNAILSMIGGPL